MSKTKLKKVLIIRNAFKNDFGGAETHALNLAIELKRLRYKPVLMTRVPLLLNRCRENGIKTKKGLWYSRQGWGRFYKIFGWIIYLWYLLFLKLNKIDIVHAHSRDDFVFATAAAKSLGIKVVWTDHADLKYILEKHNSKKLTGRILEMAKYASKVIAVSESEKNEILQRSPNFPNIKVIHNGVIFPSKIKILKKPSKIIIGCTSRLVNSKGIAELLEGYSKIKDIKKTELWLIGEGDERETFINLAKKLNIDKNVKFFGYKRDVWQYLKIIDIFVQPTYHEAFSVSLVEAAVSGCAIIATNVGGNPEIINKNNGILIPPKKALPITQALNKYIENPKLMKMHSEKLQKIALKDYNFDKIVKEKIIPIYEN